MKIYNLKNPKQKEDALDRLDKLIAKGAVIELTEKKPNRTLPQNNYLHLILTYFAVSNGYTLEETKEYFFKIECNYDLFAIKREHPTKGTITMLKSSSVLDTKQMTLAIERFKDYSASNGLTLPDANDFHFLNHIRNLEEQNRQFL